MKIKNITTLMLALLLASSIFFVTGCGDDDKPVDTVLVNGIDPNNPLYSINGAISIRVVGARHINTTFTVNNAKVIGGSWTAGASSSVGGVFCNPSLQLESAQQFGQQFSPGACGFAYGLADGYVHIQAPYEEDVDSFGTVTTIKYLELYGKLKDNSGLILRTEDAYITRFNITKTKFDLVLPLLNDFRINVNDDGIDHFQRFQLVPFE